MPFSAARRVHVRLRLSLWYALLLAATIAVIGALLLAALQEALRHSIDQELTSQAVLLEQQLALGPGTPDAAALESVLNDTRAQKELAAAGVYLQVLVPGGAMAGASPNIKGGRLPASEAVIARGLAGQQTFEDVRVDSERIRLLVYPLHRDESVIALALIGQSLNASQEALRKPIPLLGLAGLATVIISLAGGWWLTGRALAPVVGVTRVAKRIAATGHVGERVEVPAARDELYELATTLNEMLARLERTVRRQRQFLADASHELRGPLMVIRGNLDLLQMDLPHEERRESAREATEETERMARMVGDLLYLAEEDTHERMEFEPVALHEVVDEVWQRASALDAGRHTLDLRCNDAVIVLGDRHRLTQMLWNLVDNALRYTDPGGSVSICLENRGEIAELAVVDTGIGIPAEHVAHLFERFYRVDRARSRNESSTGLGLPIVKQVVEAHGGTVQVVSALGAGTTFTVTLPVDVGASGSGV